MKKRYLAILPFLLLLLCTYLRENIAVEINALIEGLNYNEAQFYFFDSYLSSFSIKELKIIKWVLTVFFVLVFLGLTIFSHFLLFRNKKILRTIFFHFAVICLGVFVIYYLSYFFAVLDTVYPILHQIIEYLFSPLPLFIFILLFVSELNINLTKKNKIMKKDKTLVFVHIPKTAGSTLHSILKNKYEKVFHINGVKANECLNEFLSYDSSIQNSFDVVKGHLTIRLLPYIKNPFVITYMREPVDHFLSVYYYTKRAKYNRNYEAVKNMDSIKEFVDYAKLKGYDNLQTRHLSNGTAHVTDISIPPVDFSKYGKENLEMAKQNLSSFDLVFDTKDFDKSLVVLSKLMAWKKKPYYLTKNVTKNRKKATDISPEIINAIKDLNRLDIELYEYFKTLKKGGEDISDIDTEVLKFKTQNKRYQMINQPIHKIKGKIYKLIKG